MAQLLSVASAFNPGQDLWIVPDTAGSRWTVRLDWYLNFQITKTSRLSPATLPHEMLDILREIDWEPSHPHTSAQAPLLVSCESRLPARWVAVVPDSSETDDWSARTVALWQGLGRPSVKIFLPTGLQAGAFTESWKRHSADSDFIMVPDLDPQSL